MYNSDTAISSSLPIRTLRLAFQYGINTIDTSPYYFPSEFVLGRALETLRPEWPRKSYYLCTKAGRYGPDEEHFDYSPETIKKSVHASLKRLRTDYLDLVYLHDVEFVAEKVGSAGDAGLNALRALHDPQVRSRLGLNDDAGKVHGHGDQVILDALRALQDLKSQGKIRAIGISGYPLPTLVRLTRLASKHGLPLDAVLSYSNHTLHSDLLPDYIRTFFDATAPAPAPMVLNGSPFSMGLLTDQGPPDWHPAPVELKQACVQSATQLAQRGDGTDTTLAQVALTYGIRGAEQTQTQTETETETAPLRTLLGMSTIEHVHAAMRAYTLLKARGDKYKDQCECEEIVRENIAQVGMQGWSWPSGRQ